MGGAMRRAARVDDNQSDIVDALRDVPGCWVEIIGRPVDLLVGFQGINYLMEVKDGSKSPSRRKLTPAQKTFWEKWTGQKAKVETPEEALAIIGVRKLGEVTLGGSDQAVVDRWEADRARRNGGGA